MAPPTLVCLVFSKDRPLQLDGALRSLKRHALGPEQPPIRVLWTASSWTIAGLYDVVAREYPDVEFVRETAFKRQLLEAIQDAAYVLLLVDDTLFVRDFNWVDAIGLLRTNPKVLGFSLRLGRNTEFCYTEGRPQQVPEMLVAGPSEFTFDWTQADADFGYPLEVSSSIYRAEPLRAQIQRLDFQNPNTLESQLAGIASDLHAQPLLACFATSVAFSVPVNVVQRVFVNRAGTAASMRIDVLGRAYRDGKRVNVAAYDGLIPAAAHQEVELTLESLSSKIPLVSVIMPCFAQANYLPEAVASVDRQTVSDWELLIIDDGSPDQTSQVAAQLAANHPDRSIRLLRRPNGGPAAARNSGVAEARGIYILPVDADDVIEPTMIEETLAVLESDPNIAFVYTDAIHFRDGVSKIVPAAEYDPGSLPLVNQPNYCALFPRSVWSAVGGFNEDIWGYEDWDFWLSLAERGWSGRRLARPLLRYRVRDDGMYATALAHDAELRGLLRRNHPDLYGWRQMSIRWVRRQTDRVASTLGRVIRRAPPLRVVAVATRAWIRWTILRPIRQRRDISSWRRSGSPAPPPASFKQAVVRDYGRRFHLRTLIESGTYFGDMVEAQRRNFRQVLSIELAPALFRGATHRFAKAQNVTLLEGDSGELLPRILAGVEEPCLFWLDGHYSAGVTARGRLETPILQELESILTHPYDHVVLVDDARCFGAGDYPTIEVLRELIASRRPGWAIGVEDDIIRIHRAGPP